VRKGQHGSRVSTPVDPAGHGGLSYNDKQAEGHHDEESNAPVGPVYRSDGVQSLRYPPRCPDATWQPREILSGFLAVSKRLPTDAAAAVAKSCNVKRGRNPSLECPSPLLRLQRMPRVVRTVFAGLPHHLTQRANRRENVFFTDEDRRTYLIWLGEYCKKNGNVIRRNINKERPCGSAKFVRRLERPAGRMLTYRSRGRPRKQE